MHCLTNIFAQQRNKISFPEYRYFEACGSYVILVFKSKIIESKNLSRFPQKRRGCLHRLVGFHSFRLSPQTSFVYERRTVLVLAHPSENIQFLLLTCIQHMRFINETDPHWLNVNLFKWQSPSFVSKRFLSIKVSVDTKYTKYQWKGISLLTIHVKSKEILICCFTFSRLGSSSLTSMLLASGVERLSTTYGSSTIRSSLRSGSVLITWK